MSEPVPPSASTDFRPAGHNLASPFRWFLAEFLVVVAGILVALALSSWAQDQRDHEREQSYLRQLNVDLEASEKILAEAEEFTRLRAEASARVLHRFWRDDLSVDDSTRQDIALPRTTGRFNPVLGTASALMSTGDLNLIRDDALRSQLVTFLDSMKTILDDIRRFDETYYRPGVHILFRGPDMFAIMRSSDSVDTMRTRPNMTERIPFPTTMEAVLRDRSVYDGYGFLLVAHRNQSFRYGAMLEKTRALRVQVVAALSETN